MQSNRQVKAYYGAEFVSSFAGGMYLYGVFFWARLACGYGDTANLALGAVNGLAYIVFAAWSGRMSDHVGCRKPVALSFVGGGLVMVALASVRNPTISFLVVGAATGLYALAWPAIESAIAHARGRTMSQRVAIFNLVWAMANPLGPAVCAMIIAWQVDAIVWVPGVLLIAGGVVFWTLTGRAEETASVAIQVDDSADVFDLFLPCRQRVFAGLTRAGNGIGYFMLSAFSALAPHVAQRLSLNPSSAILLVSLFMVGRGVAFVALFRWHGWRYRFGWATAAFWAAPLALAAIFFTVKLWVVLTALFVFGFALGLTYSGSLYYSLESSAEKGKSSGRHEAIVGLGFLGGPLIGAAGGLLGGAETSKLAVFGVAVAISAASFGRALIKRRQPCRMDEEDPGEGWRLHFISNRLRAITIMPARRPNRLS